jgi:hypothetical protein
MSEALKGNGRMVGIKLSEETKKKMSESRKKQWADPDYRTKMLAHQVNGFRGKHHTEEGKKKISDAMQGEKNPYYKKWLRGEGMRGETHWGYGLHRSEDVKEKIRKSLSGRIRPDLAGSNNGMFGKIAALKFNGPCSKGHMVRSSWELAVCDWLYKNGIEYQYEPETFFFDGFTYTPDLYIPLWDIWWEVKGWWDDHSIRQVKAFQERFGENSIAVIDKENISLFKEDMSDNPR